MCKWEPCLVGGFLGAEQKSVPVQVRRPSREDVAFRGNAGVFEDTVGQGVVRLARRNAEAISQRVGRPVVITAASAREPGKTRDCDLDGIRIEADPMAVVRAEDVDVVVELIGGLDAADALVRAAIAAGKPVVTANKALLARHGAALAALAEDRCVALACEAAVAGGIPVIKALRTNGIEVTALHNHMLDDEPRLFFMHFWANDDAGKLANGLREALDQVKVAKG